MMWPLWLRRVQFTCLVVMMAILWIRWKSCLSSLGTFLVDSQPPQSADIIVVLGGDFWGPRVIKGAELAKEGYAPLVLFSGPLYRGRPEGELAITFLVQRGYPAKLFAVFPNAAKSTNEEARALRGELTRRGARRVILVTSSYHSRRAALVLHLVCPGIVFISVPAPDPHYHAENWWNKGDSRRLFVSEWTKILWSMLIRPEEILLVEACSGVLGRSIE
jgi:uncharacterized SAM-binding protein YcdF (DUF218 family)